MKALEAFKNNLFEKRVGGLRTEHVVSPSDAYKVTWDASEVRLGRMHGDSGSDPYATLYVDKVVSRRLELEGDEASAALPYINTVDVYASGDVYIKGSSVSKRLDQLGFRKAPSFGHGAVSQYRGSLREAAGGLGTQVYPNYTVGWSQFDYVSDATISLGKPKNDFSLMRIGKIAIIQGSAWYKFKGYEGSEPPEDCRHDLLLKVSIPEGFRMVLGGRSGLGFSAFINQSATTIIPANFPGESSFVFDYGIDRFGRLAAVTLNGELTQSPFIGQPDSSNPNLVSAFWLRCPTGPDTYNGYCIRLNLNGWWQCEEGLPEPTDWK